MSGRLPRLPMAATTILGLLLAAVAAMPAVAIAEDAAQDAPAGQGNPPPPAAFLFELPGEVKTALMVALAIAIGIYLWRNLSKGD